MPKLVPGSFVLVPLKNLQFGIGRVLKDSLMSFYSKAFAETPKIGDLTNLPVAFKIFVMDRAVTSGRWKCFGHSPLSNEETITPPFFKQDLSSNKLDLIRGDVSVPVTYEECMGLERMAVWSAVHVESRLEDHILGVPNAWVDLLKAVK